MLKQYLAKRRLAKMIKRDKARRADWTQRRKAALGRERLEHIERIMTS